MTYRTGVRTREQPEAAERGPYRVLTSLALANFKGIGGPESLPIKPLTLIYGPNSAGKSSILQALLLLKQSAEHAENPEVALLPKGPHVNLGGFRELVHGHDIASEMEVRLDFTVEDELRVPVAVRNSLRLMGIHHMGVAIRFGFAGKADVSALRGIDLYVDGSRTPLVRYGPTPIDRLGTPIRVRAAAVQRDAQARTIALRTLTIDRESEVWDRLYQSAGKRRARELRLEVGSRIERLSILAAGLRDTADSEKPARGSIRGKQRAAVLEQAKEASDEIERLQVIRERVAIYTKRKAIDDFLRDNTGALFVVRNFLPIARADTELTRDEWLGLELARRSRVSLLGIPWDLGRIMLYAADSVRDFLRSVVYLGPLREYPERHYVYSGTSASDVGKSGKLLADVLYADESLIELVNAELGRFGLGYELRVSRGESSSELQDVFALRLVDSMTGVNVNLTDVGFGVSQVLPVIVQSLMSRERMLLIEQPEIHLHPRLQGELAQLLASSIKRPFGNTFLVESHSEHMILRIQRLIREGSLTPAEVSVVFVDRTESGTRLLPLRLDDGGRFIDSWPGGFFEEGFKEIFG